MTDLLRDGAAIGSDETADNFFHAHRWVLDGRADVPIASLGARNHLSTRVTTVPRVTTTARVTTSPPLQTTRSTSWPRANRASGRPRPR